ncbi:acyl-CoA dehydrogenase family protein [Noviherbaspirillum denitrificans]|uniref:Acyl-CoA dehydrogenase n=1 Tax=Noviherbaspirillum denitrificans TaxID=1968433 RepID=A0A254T6I2_9BURK|nr:acyl-CoA dehydrogenase family protein [Noviherbaspirillum denitrificans]OWW18279.1 acyl-CoA dehydrogenase [Noviherbaspirillum denitrificans]
MDFEFSPDALAMQDTLKKFTERHILPANREWHRLAESGTYPLDVIEPLKKLAKEAGLWNLFLPGLRDDEPGTRMSNLDYAPMAEIMGRIPWASEIFNCNAPDTGNMELLHMFATPEQEERWLKPILNGDIRSCFAMTEPDVASSDATNIRTTIRREGDQYVINGRKWFITNAAHPKCAFAIVLGVSDERDEADKHNRHSMVIVPMDTPGLRVVRNVPIMHHTSPEGHCELVFRDVRVPASNLLGEEGKGFALAQARLGPGRVHHCMRTIGQCELALELMCERALERRTFGKYLSEFSNVQDWIGYSRVEIDQARLLVLRAAWLMDRQGSQAARIDVSAIKLVAAQLQTRVLDRAIQVFGAMGLTPDTPLSYLWTWGRAMRFFDGPDEVHLRVLARNELGKAKANRGSTLPYYLVPEENA